MKVIWVKQNARDIHALTLLCIGQYSKRTHVTLLKTVALNMGRIVFDQEFWHELFGGLNMHGMVVSRARGPLVIVGRCPPFEHLLNEVVS